jgi:hypothetical protein
MSDNSMDIAIHSQFFGEKVLFLDEYISVKETVKALAGCLWVSPLRFDFRLLSNGKKSRSSTASTFFLVHLCLPLQR